MSIRDRISFTHSALTVLDFCGHRQRGGWWMQYPGDLKMDDLVTKANIVNSFKQKSHR